MGQNIHEPISENRTFIYHDTPPIEQILNNQYLIYIIHLSFLNKIFIKKKIRKINHSLEL